MISVRAYSAFSPPRRNAPCKASKLPDRKALWEELKDKEAESYDVWTDADDRKIALLEEKMKKLNASNSDYQRGEKLKHEELTRSVASMSLDEIANLKEKIEHVEQQEDQSVLNELAAPSHATYQDSSPGLAEAGALSAIAEEEDEAQSTPLDGNDDNSGAIDLTGDRRDSISTSSSAVSSRSMVDEEATAEAASTKPLRRERGGKKRAAKGSEEEETDDDDDKILEATGWKTIMASKEGSEGSMEIDPKTDDDASDSFSLTSTTSHESLHKGDRIAYYQEIAVFGDNTFLRQGEILAIDPEDDFPLELDTGEVISPFSFVRNVNEDDPHRKWRTLQSFQLHAASRDEAELSGFERSVAAIKPILKSGAQKLKTAMKEDGSDKMFGGFLNKFDGKNGTDFGGKEDDAMITGEASFHCFVVAGAQAPGCCHLISLS